MRSINLINKRRYDMFDSMTITTRHKILNDIKVHVQQQSNVSTIRKTQTT